MFTHAVKLQSLRVDTWVGVFSEETEAFPKVGQF